MKWAIGCYIDQSRQLREEKSERFSEFFCLSHAKNTTKENTFDKM